MRGIAATTDGGNAMANPDDIARAKQGKEVWNKWAEEELGKPAKKRASVDFSKTTISDIDFSGFIFPGYANFDDAPFIGEANFKGAIFAMQAHFLGASFYGEADF
ncbi:MAG: pentapeptide repeat-containing protein, partial [Rhodospirillales bacterium]|nr:pentapeptide repeat-containing protein [Rhodospirillales bacterium]